MSEKLKEIRNKLDKHARKMALGLTLATTLVSCGEKKDKTYTFDVQKDYSAAVVKGVVDPINYSGEIHGIPIPEKTFQLDSLEAVKDIAERIPRKCIHNKDRQKVAEAIYNNIREIENKTMGEKREFYYDADGVPNIKFGSIIHGSEAYGNSITVDGKENYTISVETPNGYKGAFGLFLREFRNNNLRALRMRYLDSLKGCSIK